MFGLFIVFAGFTQSLYVYTLIAQHAQNIKCYEDKHWI